jgi:hypothetical protein
MIFAVVMSLCQQLRNTAVNLPFFIHLICGTPRSSSEFSQAACGAGRRKFPSAAAF